MSDFKVTPEHIQMLMNRVQVHSVHTAEPVNLVTSNAYLDNSFLLATAHSKAADPANFNLEMGIQRSQAEALKAAEKKLWELEGYVQYKHLSGHLYELGKFTNQ